MDICIDSLDGYTGLVRLLAIFGDIYIKIDGQKDRWRDGEREIIEYRTCVLR